jgi:hypothetical protein
VQVILAGRRPIELIQHLQENIMEFSKFGIRAAIAVAIVAALLTITLA